MSAQAAAWAIAQSVASDFVIECLSFAAAPRAAGRASGIGGLADVVPVFACVALPNLNQFAVWRITGPPSMEFFR